MSDTNGRCLLAALLALTLGIAGARATPTIVEKAGDLYLKDSGRIIRLTTYGRNHSPAVSPDGRWVAYLSEPKWALPGLYIATNVWLMNLQTRAARRVADQPQGAAEDGPFVSRDFLFWSTDGQTLCWLDYRVQNAENVAQPSPTSVACESARGNRQQNRRVHLPPGTRNLNENSIFPGLLGVDHQVSWVNEITVLLTVTRSRPGDLAPIRVQLNTRTGELRVLSP